MSRTSTLLLTLAALLLMAVPAEARSFRVAQIPNGSTFSCGLCHNSAGGGGPRNAFGQDVEANLAGQDADWSALFDIDSDGDGFTNGEELGDPDGLWMRGDAAPVVDDVSAPADMNDVPMEIEPSDMDADGVLDAADNCPEDANADQADTDGDGIGDACDTPDEPVNNTPANNNPNNTPGNNNTNNGTPGNNNTNNGTPGNNDTNNDTNNGGNNGETPATGEDSSSDDGCAVAPGQEGSAGLLFALGALGLFTLRRRRA